MTNKIRVSGLAAASAIMMLGSLPAFSADVTPLLSISDGTSTVTINGAGTYSCTGTCSNLGVVVTLPGSITFNGTVGNFTIVAAQGNSNSSQTSATIAPAMDIGIGTLINGGSASGTLTVIWTDVGFTGMNGTTITPLTNYQSGTGSTSVYMYVDNTNNDYQGIGTTSVLSASATNLTGPSSPVTGGGITANPFGITLKEVITLGGGGLYTNDFSGTATAGSIAVVTPPPPPPTPVPSILLSKCVTTNGTTCVTGSTSVAPFVKVTYLYTVTNTSTSTTSPITGIKITDDNATPDYTADDFTVCTITSLAVNASASCTASVYPPVTEGANDSGSSFNYSNYHPGGTLICQSIDSNGNLITNGGSGNLQFHWVLDQGIVDNTYGNGAKGDWQWGSAFQGLNNNTSAEFQVYDAKGNKCVDVVQDYLANSWSYPSGYGNGGIVNGWGSTGSYYVLGTDTSLSRCLNKNKATAQCTSNSPSTSSEWIQQCAYIVKVSSSCWGSNGFGSVQCPSSASNSKTGKCNYHQNKPVNSTATNTAVAVGVFAGATVTSNKATASVAIVATPTQKCQVPVVLHCNVYAQAPSNCKPINGGHDNDGYAYSDGLLPSSITCNGTQFQLGGGSESSASSGAKIPLPATQCSSVKFLAAGVNGAQYNQPFVVTYTDGSSSTVYQNLSDWCNPSNFSGESVAVNMPYRITPNGSQQYGSINLYAYSVPTNSGKTVSSITCPNNRNVIVHAVTLCP